MIGHPGWHVLKGAQKIFTEKNLEAMILPRYNIQNCS